MTVKTNAKQLADRLAARYAALRESGVVGVRVGSFGVPYAAVHEFGFRGVVKVPNHQRLITRSFGRAIEPKRVSVRAHNRRVNIRKRPYIHPALEQRRELILSILEQEVGQKRINLEKAFLRIGMILQAQIVRNIRTQGLINTGNLLNSIRYELINR